MKLTIDEALQYCAARGWPVGRSTMYTATAYGSGPAKIKLPDGSLLFDSDALDCWLKDRAAKPRRGRPAGSRTKAKPRSQALPVKVGHPIYGLLTAGALA